MRLGALLAVNVAAVLALPSLAGAQGSAKSVAALVDEGFLPAAVGDLIMERRIIPPMDTEIFVHGDPQCRGSGGEPIFMASVYGSLRDCDVADVSVRHGKFMRMVRGAEEYVCVNDGASRCYRVSEQKTGKQ